MRFLPWPLYQLLVLDVFEFSLSKPYSRLEALSIESYERQIAFRLTDSRMVAWIRPHRGWRPVLYGDIREREGTLTVSGHVSYDSFIVYPTSIFIWVLLVSQIIVLLVPSHARVDNSVLAIMSPFIVLVALAFALCAIRRIKTRSARWLVQELQRQLIY